MTIAHLFRSTSAWRWCCLTLFFAGLGNLTEAEDALDRLKLDRLQKQHQAIEELRSARITVDNDRPFRDYRANLHVHSAFSHDSRGKIEDIVAAAKSVGTRVLMFTEHPAPHYDFVKDGHQGTLDGVLLVPGAEMKGFLVFPKQSVKAFEAAEKQEFSNLVRGRGGLIFVSHLEERMDWQIQGVSGCEIYNTHADFKNESRLISSMKNPLWLIQAKKMFDAFPQEAFSALLDYPDDYLKRWDELCKIHPHTGVSANDAHQNVGLVARLLASGGVQIEDPIGEKLIELDRKIFSAIQRINSDAKPDDELFRLQVDPYENSLRHVGTHLLMSDLSVDAVWDSINSGRVYVAFDWMADASGFDFCAVQSNQRLEMGTQTEWKPNTVLKAAAPHSVRWKVLCDGTQIHESSGTQMHLETNKPGNYRIEAWLKIVDRELPWILSNPIYLKTSEVLQPVR